MFTVNPGGTGLRRLTGWGFRDCVSPPVWSPDGRRIAFYANGALWAMSRGRLAKAGTRVGFLLGVRRA